MAHWKQRETVFGEYELALTLPGRWQLRPSDSASRWLYRSAEKHTEHLTIERFGVPSVLYQGEAPSAQHRFHVLFICPPRTVWTLVYDAFRFTEEQANAHAEEIFAAASLR